MPRKRCSSHRLSLIHISRWHTSRPCRTAPQKWSRGACSARPRPCSPGERGRAQGGRSRRQAGQAGRLRGEMCIRDSSGRARPGGKAAGGGPARGDPATQCRLLRRPGSTAPGDVHPSLLHGHVRGGMDRGAPPLAGGGGGNPAAPGINKKAPVGSGFSPRLPGPLTVKQVRLAPWGRVLPRRSCARPRRSPGRRLPG